MDHDKRDNDIVSKLKYLDSISKKCTAFTGFVENKTLDLETRRLRLSVLKSTQKKMVAVIGVLESDKTKTNAQKTELQKYGKILKRHTDNIKQLESNMPKNNNPDQARGNGGGSQQQHQQPPQGNKTTNTTIDYIAASAALMFFGTVYSLIDDEFNFEPNNEMGNDMKTYYQQLHDEVMRSVIIKTLISELKEKKHQQDGAVDNWVKSKTTYQSFIHLANEKREASDKKWNLTKNGFILDGMRNLPNLEHDLASILRKAVTGLEEDEKIRIYFEGGDHLLTASIDANDGYRVVSAQGDEHDIDVKVNIGDIPSENVGDGIHFKYNNEGSIVDSAFTIKQKK